MQLKWIRWFIYSAGAILLMAACLRFDIALGTAQVLGTPEPVLGIPLRQAILLAGCVETFVALICLFSGQVSLQIALLAWITACFLGFQGSLITMHYRQQGTCIGTLTDPLHLADGITGAVLKFIPFYLLIGSYVAMIRLWLAARKAEAARFVRTACPHCGVHIRFDHRNLGQQIVCPQCRKVVTLRGPENLKISCFFCHEHIEFPAHAIGQRLKCPHCKMDITLKLSAPL